MKKRQSILFLIILFCVLIVQSISAQQNPIYLKKGKVKYNYYKSISIFVDSSAVFPGLKSIMQEEFSPITLWKGKANPKHTYWARYQFICNETSDYYFYFGNAEHITVYFVRGNKVAKKEIGDFVPRSKADVKVISKAAKERMIKGDTATVYVRLFNETYSRPRVGLSIYDGETYIKKWVFQRLTWQALFHAAIWMMIAYMFLMWLSIRDSEYLFYVMYMVAISATFFLNDQIHYHVLTQLAEFPLMMRYLEQGLAHFAIVMYFLFMQKLINTKEVIPKIHKIMLGWIILRLVTLPLVVYANIYLVIDNVLLSNVLLLDFIFLIVVCVILLFKNDPIARYFAIGSLLLSVLAGLSILSWDNLKFLRDYTGQLNQIGILGQIIFFAMILGYKTRKNTQLVFELQDKNENLLGQLKSKVKEQEKTLNIFKKFVPEPVVAKILNQGAEEDIFGGEIRYVSALFCDIRGFTTLSEQLKPNEIVRFLNDFYAQMSVIIKKYGGSINQFIGDEIFAVFGAPLSTSNNEQRSVLAALEMIERIKYLNEKYEEAFQHEIIVGIGINSGEVIAGNLGSNEKIGYTVCGDTVNTAKRIEGLTKSIPNSIMISETVYVKVASIVEAEFIETVHLKGKTNKVNTYRVYRKK